MGVGGGGLEEGTHCSSFYNTLRTGKERKQHADRQKHNKEVQGRTSRARQQGSGACNMLTRCD